MYYVYILVSLKDNNFYVGLTKDLKIRLKKHIDGMVPSTKNRRPLKLIGYEAYLFKQEAGLREKYLKSNDGRKEMRIRFKISINRLTI